MNRLKKVLNRIRESFYWRRLWIRDPVEWYRQRALRYGVKMGKDCRIMSLNFSSEPYLIELGDHVLVAADVSFITHEAGWVFTSRIHPDRNVFGRIKVGNNVSIGMGAIIMPNTEIGDNCVIGAGCVVRGRVPPNTVYAGNPGKVVMTLDLYKKAFFGNRRLLSLLIDGPEADTENKKSVLAAFFSAAD
jgi:acetyltransferase-like isoleucine patch superfamily enzyme